MPSSQRPYIESCINTEDYGIPVEVKHCLGTTSLQETQAQADKPVWTTSSIDFATHLQVLVPRQYSAPLIKQFRNNATNANSSNIMTATEHLVKKITYQGVRTYTL